jgi:hypothetical protein
LVRIRLWPLRRGFQEAGRKAREEREEREEDKRPAAQLRAAMPTIYGEALKFFFARFQSLRALRPACLVLMEAALMGIPERATVTPAAQRKRQRRHAAGVQGQRPWPLLQFMTFLPAASASASRTM